VEKPVTRNIALPAHRQEQRAGGILRRRNRRSGAYWHRLDGSWRNDGRSGEVSADITPAPSAIRATTSRRVASAWFCSGSCLRSHRNLDYSYGGVLDLSARRRVAGRAELDSRRTASAVAQSSAERTRTKTRWIASYRYMGGRALTPVDEFNTSPGQADPYLNVCFRQPIPASFFAGHMEISWIFAIFSRKAMCPSWPRWAHALSRAIGPLAAAAWPSALRSPLLSPYFF